MASSVRKVDFEITNSEITKTRSSRSNTVHGGDLPHLRSTILDQDLKPSGSHSNAITSIDNSHGDAKKNAKQIDDMDKPPLQRRESATSLDKSKVDSSRSRARSNSGGEKKDREKAISSPVGEDSKSVDSPRARGNSTEKKDQEKASSSTSSAASAATASPKKGSNFLGRKRSKSVLTESKVESTPLEMQQSIKKAGSKRLQLPSGIFKLENHFDQIKTTFRGFISPDFKAGNYITINSKVIEIPKLSGTEDQARYIEFLTAVIQHLDSENVSAATQATLLMTENNLSQTPSIHEKIPSVHVLRSMTPGAFAKCFESLKKFFPTLFQDAVQTRAQTTSYKDDKNKLNMVTDGKWTTHFDVGIKKDTGTFTTTQTKQYKLQLISDDGSTTDVGTCLVHWKIEGNLNGVGLMTGSLILDSLKFEEGTDLELQYLFAKSLKLLDEK